MKICTAKLVICRIIVLAAILGTTSAVLSHPKLRRSVTFPPQNSSTASFIMVWKDIDHSANITSRNVTVSDLMGRVEASGSSEGDGDIPVVENARDNGIGVTADMNQAALERVSALEWCVRCAGVPLPTQAWICVRC